MKLEFQYDIADYREATRAHTTPPSSRGRALILMMLGISLVCLIVAAIGPVSPAVTSATTAPVPLSDFGMSLVPYLAFLMTLPLALMFSQPKIKSAGRKFDHLPAGSRRQLSSVSTLFLNLTLGIFSIAIYTIRQNRFSGGTNGWMEWLPWATGLALFWLIFRGIYKRAWKQQPGLTRHRTIEYSQDVLTCADDLITTTYRWAAFLRCVETTNLFLLYPSGLQFIMVPKRIFPTREEEEHFRQLIRNWEDGRSVGFPVIQVER